MSEHPLSSDLLERGPDDADWSDVLRRVGGKRRRRKTAAMVAAVAIVATGIASAYAFGHPIIDFSKAPKGPEKVVNDFGSLVRQANLIVGMNHQAAKLTKEIGDKRLAASDTPRQSNDGLAGIHQDR